MSEESTWLSWMPDWAMEEYLSVTVSQWVAIFGILFIGLLLRLATIIIVHRWLEKLTGDIEGVDELWQERAAPHFGLAVMGGLWWLLVSFLSLSESAEVILVAASKLVVVVGLVAGFYRLIDLLHILFRIRSGGELSATEEMFIPLLERTMRLFVIIIGIMTVAETFNFDLTTVLAGLGLGGLAVALAAKDTISNLFGSLTILLDRPFRLGDWVLIEDIEGTVEKIGFRTTKIRTFANTLISVPNSTLVNNPVENFGMREYRRYSTHIHLDLATPVHKVEAFMAGVLELIQLHPYTRKDYQHVTLHHIGKESLEILLYVFWKTSDWGLELKERERLLLDTMKLAEALGVCLLEPRVDFNMAVDGELAALTNPKVDSTEEPVKKGGRKGKKPQNWRDIGCDAAKKLVE